MIANSIIVLVSFPVCRDSNDATRRVNLRIHDTSPQAEWPSAASISWTSEAVALGLVVRLRGKRCELNTLTKLALLFTTDTIRLCDIAYNHYQTSDLIWRCRKPCWLTYNIACSLRSWLTFHFTVLIIFYILIKSNIIQQSVSVQSAEDADCLL